MSTFFSFYLIVGAFVTGVIFSESLNNQNTTQGKIVAIGLLIVGFFVWPVYIVVAFGPWNWLNDTFQVLFWWNFRFTDKYKAENINMDHLRNLKYKSENEYTSDSFGDRMYRKCYNALNKRFRDYKNSKRVPSKTR